VYRIGQWVSSCIVCKPESARWPRHSVVSTRWFSLPELERILRKYVKQVVQSCFSWLTAGPRKKFFSASRSGYLRSSLVRPSRASPGGLGNRARNLEASPVAVSHRKVSSQVVSPAPDCAKWNILPRRADVQIGLQSFPPGQFAFTVVIRSMASELQQRRATQDYQAQSGQS